MDIKEKKVFLIEKWNNIDLYECMLQEIVEEQEKSAEMLKIVVDLQNRLRHLEYLADPIPDYCETYWNPPSDVVKEKP